MLIAARDAGGTLADTLASLRAQTYAGWEAIVVDDGSSDATAEIARAAGARVLRNEHPQGPSAARNRAAGEATGELLAILDADDLWRPEYLERQLATYDGAVAAGRRVGAVCCDAELLTPDGEPTGRLFSERVRRVERIDLDALLEDNVVFGLAVVPKAVFDAVGGYDEEAGVEDYDLWLRVAAEGYEIVRNQEVLASYRLGRYSRSSQVEREVLASIHLFDRVLERGGLTPRQRRIARRRRRVFQVVLRRARIAAEPRPGRRALMAAGAAPLILVSAVEHPARWRDWMRRGVRSTGTDRHTHHDG